MRLKINYRYILLSINFLLLFFSLSAQDFSYINQLRAREHVKQYCEYLNRYSLGDQKYRAILSDYWETSENLAASFEDNSRKLLYQILTEILTEEIVINVTREELILNDYFLQSPDTRLVYVFSVKFIINNSSSLIQYFFVDDRSLKIIGSYHSIPEDFDLIEINTRLETKSEFQLKYLEMAQNLELFLSNFKEDSLTFDLLKNDLYDFFSSRINNTTKINGQKPLDEDILINSTGTFVDKNVTENLAYFKSLILALDILLKLKIENESYRLKSFETSCIYRITENTINTTLNHHNIDLSISSDSMLWQKKIIQNWISESRKSIKSETLTFSAMDNQEIQAYNIEFNQLLKSKNRTTRIAHGNFLELIALLEKSSYINSMETTQDTYDDQYYSSCQLAVSPSRFNKLLTTYTSGKNANFPLKFIKLYDGITGNPTGQRVRKCGDIYMDYLGNIFQETCDITSLESSGF